MNQEQQPNHNTDSDDEIVYKGSSIPVFLRWTYVIFLAWAFIYAISYVFPDLSVWLNK